MTRRRLIDGPQLVDYVPQAARIDSLAQGDVQRGVPEYNRPRSIQASGMRLDLKAKTTATLLRTTDRSWQRSAWDFYDTIGEVKFAFNMVAHIMSRIRLFPGVIEDKDAPPVPLTDWYESLTERTGAEATNAKLLLETGNQALEELDDGISGGLSGYMRESALNMQVAGEFFLVRRVRGDWRIVSVDGLESTSGANYRLRSSRASTSDQGERLGKDPYVARIWRNHPRFHRDADSSLLGVLDQCDKLVLLDKVLRAAARSRVSAGMLFMPDGIMAATGSGADEDMALENLITDALLEPVLDEAAITSLVPLLLRGPQDLGEKIKHLPIMTDISEAIAAEADRALQRIMQGIDVPKDIVSGLADVKYANAVVINDDLFRAHVEPLALLLVDTLTQVYYRPYLRKLGVPPAMVKKAVVWYDASAVVTRPDRSSAANEGYDRMLLSAHAWRTARGFSEADAPSDDELLHRVAFDKGQLPPEVTIALVKHFAPDVFREIEANERKTEQMPTDIQSLLDGAAPAGEAPPDELLPTDAPAEPGELPPPDEAPGGAMPPVPPA